MRDQERLSIKEFINRCSAALAEGNAEEAMALSGLMLSSYPLNAQALLFAGTISFQVEEYQRAEEYFSKVLLLDPSHAQAREYLLYALYLADDIDVTDQTVDLFTKILRQPKDLNVDLISRVFVKIVHRHRRVEEIIEQSNSKNYESAKSFLCALSQEDLKLLSSDFMLLGFTLGLIPDKSIANFLTFLRHFFLECALSSLEIKDSLAYQRLAIAIAQAAFDSGYLFQVTDTEEAMISELKQSEIKSLNAFKVAIIASYEPLYKSDHICHALQKIFSPISGKMELKALIRQQVFEPQEEQRIAQTIPTMSPIKNQISGAVRQQYEENPYPKWTLPKAVHCDDLPTQLGAYSKKDLKILIAGCATGEYPINVARANPKARVTGVDLSAASLAYGMRKANELKVKNIVFFQGDILDIAAISSEFDIIETVGVLHHMQYPQQGLDALCKVLSSDGYIKIGLYSALARRNITACQKELAAMGIRPTPQDIRKAQYYIASLPEGHAYKAFEKYNDFYNASMFRDMLLHVQEHCFTIPQIKEMLELSGLEFLGFSDIGTGKAFEAYRKQFPDDQGMINLDNWHIFEQSNPDTFIGMYKFWCRKI